MIELLTRTERYRALLVERCLRCRDLRADGADWSIVETAHDRCHGWFHCDDESCGGCTGCRITAEIEIDLEAWEKEVS